MHHRGLHAGLQPASRPVAIASDVLLFPFRLTRVVVEWLLGDVIAWIGTLPVLVVVHAQGQIARARSRSQTQLEVERIQRSSALLEAAVAAHVRHFEDTVRAVDRLERQLKEFDPTFRQSLETALAVFDQEVRQLRDLSIQSGGMPRLLRDVEALMDEPRRDDE